VVTSAVTVCCLLISVSLSMYVIICRYWCH